MSRFFILLPVFSLALSAGYLHGRLLAVPQSQMSLKHDVRPLVPTVELMGIRNGRVVGVVHGDARLILGKAAVIGSGAFAIPAGTFLTNVIEIDIPPGALFVASRRGKKYYPVASAQARNLSPDNRVYFRGAAEAEAAGFLP